MFEPGRRLALQFGNNALGQHFAQLDAPLVERINVPNHALGEDAVLVKRDEFAKNFRREPVDQDHVGRTVALEHPVRHEPIRCAFGFHFRCGLAESERLGLRKNIRQKNVVVPTKRCQRVTERDKVTRDEPRPLVDQLIERVLAVGAGFAPVDRAGLVIHFLPGKRDVLAVALHRELLEIGGEAGRFFSNGMVRKCSSIS